jgi:uncharacterized membrane protein
MEVTFMFGWEQCWGFWWIFPIFMFIMIVGCIFMMRRISCMSGWRFPGGRNRWYSADPAEEILRRRYALGEIDQKEYEEMKETISQDNKRR